MKYKVYNIYGIGGTSYHRSVERALRARDRRPAGDGWIVRDDEGNRWDWVPGAPETIYKKEGRGGVGAWLPIATAPKDATIVDLWSPSHGRLIGYRRAELSPTNVYYAPAHSGVCCVRDATHWMPEPEPPTLFGTDSEIEKLRNI